MLEFLFGLWSKTLLPCPAGPHRQVAAWLGELFFADLTKLFDVGSNEDLKY